MTHIDAVISNVNYVKSDINEKSKLGKYHASLRAKSVSLDNDLFLKDIIKETTPIERAAWWTKIIKEFREKLFN